MNIRQLHDELRKPGPKVIGYGDEAALSVDAKGNIHIIGDGDFVCTLSDLERDDWFTRKPKGSRT